MNAAQDILSLLRAGTADERADAASAIVEFMRQAPAQPAVTYAQEGLQMLQIEGPDAGLADFHERWRLLNGLIEYVSSAEQPSAGAVWALAEARAPIGKAALEKVVQQWLSSETYDSHTAFQAVVGLSDLPKDAVPFETLRKVARAERDIPSEYATEWIDAHGLS